MKDFSTESLKQYLIPEARRRHLEFWSNRSGDSPDVPACSSIQFVMDPENWKEGSLAVEVVVSEEQGKLPASLAGDSQLNVQAWEGSTNLPTWGLAVDRTTTEIAKDDNRWMTILSKHKGCHFQHSAVGYQFQQLLSDSLQSWKSKDRNVLQVTTLFSD